MFYYYVVCMQYVLVGISNPMLYTTLTIISETLGVVRYMYPTLYPTFHTMKVCVDMVREMQKIILFCGINTNAASYTTIGVGYTVVEKQDDMEEKAVLMVLMQHASESGVDWRLCGQHGTDVSFAPLMAKATQQYGVISPCYGEDGERQWSECIDDFGLWFNDKNHSTHIVKWEKEEQYVLSV